MTANECEAVCPQAHNQTTSCTQPATYGMLCHIHARFYRNCSTSKKQRRFIRRHVPHLNIKDLEVVLNAAPSTWVKRDLYHPYFLKDKVVTWLKEVGPASANQVTEHFNRTESAYYTTSQIADMLRSMSAGPHGPLTTRRKCRGGITASEYYLKAE